MRRVFVPRDPITNWTGLDMAFNTEIEKLERRWAENPLGLTFAPLAEAYRKAGETAKALDLLEVGIAQHPNYVPAHIVRGRCHLDAQANEQAQLAFTRVTELDPENVIALKGLADLAEREGRFSDAIARLESLLEVDRNNDDAQGQLERVRELLSAPPALAPAPPPSAEVEAPAEPISPWAPVQEHTLDPSGDMLDDDTHAEIKQFQPPELTSRASTEFQLSRDVEGLQSSDVRLAEILMGPGATEHQLPTEEGARGKGMIAAPDPSAATGPSLEALAPEPEMVLPEEHLLPPPSVELQYEELDIPPSVTDFEAATEVAPETQSIHHEEAALWSEPEPEPQPEPVPEVIAAKAEPEPAPDSVVETVAAEAESEPEAEPVGGSPEPELVVTETMAEIFLRQGHRELALAVYSQLLQREPENGRVAASLTRLQEELRPAAMEPPGAPEAPRRYGAVATGGKSVGELFAALLSAGRPTAAAAVHPPTFESPRRPSGEPTRPSPDSLSLSAVFGEGAPPAGPAGAPPETGTAEPSFDQFFAASEEGAAAVELPKGHPTEAAAMAAPAPEDLEQFNAWLRGLKR